MESDSFDSFFSVVFDDAELFGTNLDENKKLAHKLPSGTYNHTYFIPESRDIVPFLLHNCSLTGKLPKSWLESRYQCTT